MGPKKLVVLFFIALLDHAMNIQARHLSIQEESLGEMERIVSIDDVAIEHEHNGALLEGNAGESPLWLPESGAMGKVPPSGPSPTGNAGESPLWWMESGTMGKVPPSGPSPTGNAGESPLRWTESVAKGKVPPSGPSPTGNAGESPL